MNPIVAAVCDCDETYVERFALYARKHYAEQVIIHTFTKLETFMEGLLKQRFHIVLLGGGFDEAKEGIRQYQIPILYLEEEVWTDVKEEEIYDGAACGSNAVYCVAEDTAYQSPRIKSILKYQSAETILHEIYRACEKDDMAEAQYHRVCGKIEWIAVCSPIRHEMQMPFSVTLAALLAEKKKVLYINLMEWSGFLELFQLEGERDLGDLLVKVRQNRLSGEGFWQMVNQNGSLYYIPPAANPENLYQLEQNEYFKLMAFLEKETDFEAVVLDFGSVPQGFFEILESCNTVFSIMKNSAFLECRRRQFERAIERSGHLKLLEKMQTLYLPYSAAQAVPAIGLLEQLKWSEIGDMARKHLFGAADYDNRD